MRPPSVFKPLALDDAHKFLGLSPGAPCCEVTRIFAEFTVSFGSLCRYGEEL